ncbi:DUF5071 domain-containing protein [Paenibacillus pabuli]|nr:DUF5071 domain-containing protein [Paenibacillus pabuli]UPK42217.1 DUF5071 domain-containing protein [Paenibacillus pabuli]
MKEEMGMDVREWLPRDKHDFDAVRKLRELSNEKLRDIVPELMWCAFFTK